MKLKRRQGEVLAMPDDVRKRTDEIIETIKQIAVSSEEGEGRPLNFGYFFLAQKIDSQTDNIRQEIKTDINNLKQEVKSDINNYRHEIKTDMNNIRQEMKEDINSFRKELKTDINDLRQEIKTDMNNIRQGMKEDINSLRKEVDTNNLEMDSRLTKVYEEIQVLKKDNDELKKWAFALIISVVLGFVSIYFK